LSLIKKALEVCLCWRKIVGLSYNAYFQYIFYVVLVLSLKFFSYFYLNDCIYSTNYIYVFTIPVWWAGKPINDAGVLEKKRYQDKKDWTAGFKEILLTLWHLLFCISNVSKCRWRVKWASHSYRIMFSVTS
jgi:hypothetical protein